MTVSTLDVRLCAEARAFLRTVRHAGGSLHIGGELREVAKTCAAAGVLVFTGSAKRETGVALTGRGHAYLDRLMRAH
ncbi:hypothetical protein AC244_15995 [Ensifer adhaerens]|uniref:Uncharacterized protein n=1 Tax=Ensifer adhaerens TaxID=106592 RepID=A0A0L8BT29_ENSAD|nr:hypothetical protein [Ensifer adhaerens]KOF17867.1 hypothetical protein AC244_15995 [Ensifer adhaerens]